ncbi:hypothetical protein Nepgr_006111 [Nepenthes gracilis]|uniref:DUF547 domain-containing protein n=1 Tax=Nepenthes gracilis TaxID=150966 RepID=A0AAD3XH25_NEPGR|nr:hypothetical protein Nepgr_006111 [Nepenthes gracilis]
MKFEDLLMQPSEGQHRRLALEEEVEELQERLNGELLLNGVLRSALRGPALSCHYLSLKLPIKVQVLLAELAMVEEEIIWLERKVEKLKLKLYREKQLKNDPKQMQMQLNTHHHKQLSSCTKQNRGEVKYLEWFSPSLDHEVFSKHKIQEGRKSLGSAAADVHSFSATRSNEDVAARSWKSIRSNQRHALSAAEINIEKPNRVSEELLKCLIGLFLKMNQLTEESEGATSATKHTLSCINSRAFTPKTTFNCKARSSFNNDNAFNLDNYGISPDYDGILRDAGPYKNFIQITRSSLNTAHISHFNRATRKLTVLMRQLSNFDLTLLTYKQKLAFWINIYNSCIMHAYLQHGLPSTQERMLALMNKAALNVGGIVLNALAIEHYILRHPGDSKYDPIDEKEMLLRHAYGLQYPEPNVTFALCRGNWSSPALKVYTPDDVVNELERAKVEYLEASVGVTGKKGSWCPNFFSGTCKILQKILNH